MWSRKSFSSILTSGLPSGRPRALAETTTTSNEACKVAKMNQDHEKLRGPQRITPMYQSTLYEADLGTKQALTKTNSTTVHFICLWGIRNCHQEVDSPPRHSLLTYLGDWTRSQTINPVDPWIVIPGRLDLLPVFQSTQATQLVASWLRRVDFLVARWPSTVYDNVALLIYLLIQLLTNSIRFIYHRHQVSQVLT